MDKSEFAKKCDETLKDILRGLDQLDLGEGDVMLSDGKLVIEFEDGVTFIINRQGGANQIWLAEPSYGWHFNYQDGQWICDKRGVELYSSLEALISAKLGQPIKLRK